MSEQNDSFQAMCLQVVFVSDILRNSYVIIIMKDSGSKQNQFYSLPFGQAVASMY